MQSKENLNVAKTACQYYRATLTTVNSLTAAITTYRLKPTAARRSCIDQISRRKLAVYSSLTLNTTPDSTLRANVIVWGTPIALRNEITVPLILEVAATDGWMPLGEHYFCWVRCVLYRS